MPLHFVHGMEASDRPGAGAPSIGELNERSLHRALKARYAAGGNATEQAIDGFVADVVVGDRIVEVHTGSFVPLKRRLPPLLARHPVTLVYPIARDRYIVKTAARPSAPAKRRMSPKHGSVLEVFSVLVSIPALLAHPNLTLEVVLTVEEEVRAINRGRSRWRQAWVRADRRLVDVVAVHVFASMADLFAMLDGELPERFTTGDLAAAMGASRRLAGQAAFCFREGGVSEVCGKEGNALVYRRPDPRPAARSLLRRGLLRQTGFERVESPDGGHAEDETQRAENEARGSEHQTRNRECVHALLPPDPT